MTGGDTRDKVTGPGAMGGPGRLADTRKCVKMREKTGRKKKGKKKREGRRKGWKKRGKKREKIKKEEERKRERKEEETGENIFLPQYMGPQ